MADQDYKETLSLDASNFINGLQAAQVALGSFASDIAVRAVDAVKDFIKEIVGMAQVVGNAAENLENLSAATGVSEKNLTTLSSLAKVSGASMEGLASVMRILSRNMQEADQGSVEMQAKLRLLGITSRDAWTALMQVTETLGRVDADTKRLAISTEVLGRGFAQILPAIKDGVQAFEDAEERAIKMGTAFDSVREGKIKKMDDAFDRLGIAIEGFWQNIVGALAPAIEGIVDAMTELVVIVTELTGLLSFDDAIMAQWIRFNTLLREIGVNAIGVMSGQVFSEAGRAAMRKEIDAIEAEAQARLMELKKKSLSPAEKKESKPSIGDPTDIKQLVKNVEAEQKLEQEHVSATQKINKSHFEYEKSLIAEKLVNHKITNEQAVAETMQAEQRETAGQAKALAVQLSQLGMFHRERMVLASPQERIGLEGEYSVAALKLVADLEVTRVKSYTQEVQARVKTNEGKKKDDQIALEDAVNMAQARVTVAETEFASYEEMAVRRMALLRAQKNLGVHQAESNGRESVSIQKKYDGLIGQEQERSRNGMIRGIKEGYVKLINDTDSMFGLGVSMARQSAQAMQQAFQSFFFDLFEGKIQSLKDVLKSFLNFVKQVVSQVLAQLATTMILKAIAGGIGGIGGSADGSKGLEGLAQFSTRAEEGGLIRRYSLGGPVLSNGDSVPAMLTPGEFVVSRQGVDALSRINQGQPMNGGNENITVNVVNSGKDEKPQVNFRRELKGMVLDIIFRNVAENGDMRKLLRA